MFQYMRTLMFPDKSLPPGATARPLCFYDPSMNCFVSISSSTGTTTVTAKPLTSLRLLTWNVDYSAPDPAGRISALVDYLSTFKPIPDILLLQEMHPAALNRLLETPWIRSNFATTDTSLPVHPAKYGTITLVHLDLAPATQCAFRLPFKTSVMGRDSLFLDLRVVRPPNEKLHGPRGGILRIANTHLESLAGWGERARRVQLLEIMSILGMQEVFAGLVAGDMNAIGPGDVHLPEECGAEDLWLIQGHGLEHTDGSGDTWGHQPPCDFPPGRLDKILVNQSVSGGRVQLDGEWLRVVGKELKAPNGEFVSDHSGLLADVRLG